MDVCKLILKEPHYFLDEVAAALRVSVKTVRRLIKGGKLPAFKIGGRVCILASAIDVYLQNQISNTGGKLPC